MGQLSNSETAETRVLKILVAEDNVTNIKVITALLAHRGHFVKIAQDGLEAVRAAQTDSYDIIFMDIQMPGLDGIEATKKIRALKGLSSRSPIVAVTANGSREDLRNYRNAGMDGFIAKPIKPALLYALLDIVINGETIEWDRAPASSHPLQSERTS